MRSSWSDEASAALLHYVVRAGVQGLVVACGARPAELYDNPHALRLVRALGREGRLDELRLSPLDASAIVALARTVAPDADAERVFADSQGNPLFALEVAGALARGDAGSVRLDDLIDERLARLEGRAADVVAWAAALGRSFDADVLGRVTGVASADLVSAVDELERRGVIRARVSGAASGAAVYDFVHDLVRLGAYRRLSHPRRRLVHLHIARALDALGADGDALSGDVAHHAALGGDAELAVRAYVSAGQRSLRLFANAAASELAARGLQLAATLPTKARIERSSALYGVAVLAHARERDVAPLEDAITRLVVEAQSAGLFASVERGLHFLSVLRYRREDFDKAARDSFLAVEASDRSDPATNVHALTHAGACLAMLGRDIPRARALLEHARRLATHHATPMAVTQFRMGLGCVHHFAGEYDAALRELAETVELACLDADHFRASVCLSHLCMMTLERGEYAEAIRVAQRLVTIADKLGDGSEGPFARAVEALARLRLGEAGAAAHVDAALAGLRAIDSKGLLSYALAEAAEIDLGAGDAARALARAGEAEEAATAVSRPSETAVARAMAGRAALALGRRDEALETLRSLLGDLAERGLLSARAHAAAAKLAAALGVALEGVSGSGTTRAPVIASADGTGGRPEEE